MRATSHSADPFDMLIDPDAVIRAMQGSSRLRALKRRVCRPLDKPLIPTTAQADVTAFDAEVDGIEDDRLI